jgi:hypothetical protein
MAAFPLAVTAFGYRVPLTILLVALALVVGLLLAVAFYLTVGLSVYYSVTESRRNRVRPDLRTELLDRLFAADPGWNEWVTELSAFERQVLESLLDEHLRELEGDDAETLRELGDALGIPERAGGRLESAGEYGRLHALTWLTLLRRPEPYLASAYEPLTPRERAAVVTLLDQTDRLPDAGTGVGILLDGIDEQFTVFGQDTLYRVARNDPEPLLRAGSEAYRSWPEPVLGQILAVCAHLETSVREGDLAWITAVLETGNEAMRAAAANALARFGWRASLREQPFFERAVNDPSPEVRAAVYDMLASWGDEAALQILQITLLEESNQRALTAGTAALVGHRERLDTDPARLFGAAWTWSLEHAEYDRLARQSTSDGVRG